MKICVFGAGAIGGYMAVELANAGYEVSVVARGDHLQAIRENGLKLLINGGEKTTRLPASDNPGELGVQDVVICSLKAHQAAKYADMFQPLLGPDTCVVTAMNGIPWWYFYKEGGEFDGRQLQSVDPGGHQWQIVGPERAIGAVVDPACEVIAPGIIEHHMYNRFILGEPDSTVSERVQKIASAFENANLDAPVKENIRWNIWLKLWGNVCFNPISALTHSTLDRITGTPVLRELCKTIMLETKRISERLGIEIPEKMIERRLDAAGKVVGHKMSMLQDLERNRSMEIDALVTVVQELGKLVQLPTPNIDVVLALVQERGRIAGLY